MKENGVSETIGAIILVSVAGLAMGIVLLVLLAGPLPANVPSFSATISNKSTTIYISHLGGDPLYSGQYKILVDGKDRTGSFAGPNPFTVGTNLSYTSPTMPSHVVMIFNTSWGGGTVLAAADLVPVVNITSASGTYYLWNQTVTGGYRMYTTKPNGINQSSYATLQSFYSSPFVNGIGLNAGTTTVYLNLYKNGAAKLITVDLSYGSGSTWTLLGTGGSTVSASPETLVTVTLATNGHNFAAGEYLNLTIDNGNSFTVYWDGPEYTSRLVTP